MKFKTGDIVPGTTLESVTGEPIKLPDPDRLVHLQFRRFVDCPICNTHIAEVRRRAREIEAAGVKEGDRLSLLRQVDPVVPEGCSIRAGWRSEEGPLQRIWRGIVAWVPNPQVPGRRHARGGMANLAFGFREARSASRATF